MLHLLFALSAAATEQWALIVTGSKTFENYRHHADVAHAYQRLVAGGIPKEHIISFQYNDVPLDPENPFPGSLFNFPSGKKRGVDVNAGFEKSYTGADVSADGVLAALLCNTTSPCLASSSSDATLFVFWAGHGDVGLLFMPDMQASNALYADQLVDALRAAQQGNARSP